MFQIKLKGWNEKTPSSLRWTHKMSRDYFRQLVNKQVLRIFVNTEIITFDDLPKYFFDDNVKILDGFYLSSEDACRQQFPKPFYFLL